MGGNKEYLSIYLSICLCVCLPAGRSVGRSTERSLDEENEATFLKVQDYVIKPKRVCS